MQFDIPMTDQLLSTTRAVRRRLDRARPVPRDVIEECLEVAIQAPTGGNAQGWRWLVVDDPDVRGQLADLCRRADNGRFAASEQRARARGDQQTAKVYASANALLEDMEQIPLFVIPCLTGRPTEPLPAARWASLMGSIFPAIWSFQLALRARGLGSVLTTLHLFEEQEAARILGLPEHILQVALLPVAYTLGTDFKPAKRRSASEVTHWNHWSEPT